MIKRGHTPERSSPAPLTDRSAPGLLDDNGKHPDGGAAGRIGTVEKAARWICSECGVSAGQMDGTPTQLPEGWTSSDGGLCLICRRERAADSVLDSVPAVRNLAARVRLRKAAILDFEVSRVPDRSNGQIAGACHTSPRAVAESRLRLAAESDPSSAGS